MCDPAAIRLPKPLDCGAANRAGAKTGKERRPRNAEMTRTPGSSPGKLATPRRSARRPRLRGVSRRTASPPTQAASDGADVLNSPLNRHSQTVVRPGARPDGRRTGSRGIRNRTAPWPWRRAAPSDEALAGGLKSSAKGMTPRAHPGSNPDFAFTIASRRAAPEPAAAGRAKPAAVAR